MAPNQAVRSKRVRSGKESSRAGGVRKKTKSNASAAETQPPPDNPSDADALRKKRLEYLEKPLEERRKKMRYVGEIVAKEPATRKDAETVKKASEVRRRYKATTADTKHGHHKVRVTVRKIKELDEGEFVYPRAPETEADNDDDPKTPGAEAASVKSVAPVRSKTRRKLSVDDKQELEEGRRPQRRQSEPLRRRNSNGLDDKPRTSARENVRPTISKSVTNIHDKARPTLQRSTTSAQPKTDARLPRSNTAPERTRKAPSLFSRLLLPTPHVPDKKISCLTCGSDDVPISRSARLACSHRMCHECLQRIFTMSVTDPAHMPPRCCTSEHIPLKHVDNLFDQNFKKTWNRKFQEYTTRNRIYCPARSCGEWIKPSHITTEHGRKVGKCKRCNTRVCCTCNNKMHTSRECPKDPATKEFVEIAKEKGWQRCHSCSAMVELKEGCNHMTCRCTAEFCMVCGSKWKSCDCPWFNYENVDAHLGNPIRYQEELDRRREQEQIDEAIARRMQGLGVAEEDNGPIGAGNAAGRHVNDDFVQQARNILTGNFRQAVLEAEGLVNGTPGRENPLPGPPLFRDQVAHLLRQQNQRRNGDVPLPAPLPRRQGTFRRQTANPVGGNRHAAANQDGEAGPDHL
jgi:hypothetical protein